MPRAFAAGPWVMLLGGGDLGRVCSEGLSGEAVGVTVGVTVGVAVDVAFNVWLIRGLHKYLFYIFFSIVFFLFSFVWMHKKNYLYSGFFKT